MNIIEYAAAPTMNYAIAMRDYRAALEDYEKAKGGTRAHEQVMGARLYTAERERDWAMTLEDARMVLAQIIATRALTPLARQAVDDARAAEEAGTFTLRDALKLRLFILDTCRPNGHTF